MSVAPSLIAGVELGGTKCIATLARGRTILRQERWPTATPATLDLMSDQLSGWYAEEPFAAIGIASFGPLGLNRAAPDFGRMGNTPKPGWAGVDVYGHFAERFTVPVGIDTDVAGAALAEGHWGASKACQVHGYATIGTGVGLGIVINGKPVHGQLHPEAGHMRIRRQPGDSFTGRCPTHGDCLEGLVAGPGLAARAGVPLQQVPDEDPLWNAVARDLAEWLAILILTLSPERLVIGGGMMEARPLVFPIIRANVARLLNGYLQHLDESAIARLIVPPLLGPDAGPLGAVLLGDIALKGDSVGS